MEKINKLYFYLVALLAIAITSCEDDKVLPVLSSDSSTFEAPDLMNSETGTPLVLEFDNASEVIEVFEWADADYGVALPVKYTIQTDVDDNFAAPFDFATDLSATTYSVTVGQMNAAALSLGLEPFEENTIKIRVIGKVTGAEVDDTVSPVITRTVTAYVTEFGPIYMIGGALKGWDTGKAVEVYGVGPSRYEVVAEFNNGEAFRFFEQADWNANSYNWTFFDGGTIDSNFENANDGDTNIRFIGTTGYYKISINLKTKEIGMESLPGQPTLFMVGSGVPEAGWGWDNPVAMTWVRDGVFEATTQFDAGDGNAFRFFTINADWGSGLNYPHYANNEYEIDATLTDAMDGDNNFKFVGNTGVWKITVDDVAKTIVISEAGTAGPPKYLVGAGVPAAGWGWDSPVELVQVQAGVFTTSTEFAVDAFRIFSANGDWGSGTNYPGFADAGYTIDSNFENAADGDQNFKFIGTPGSYKFTLNENTKTITLE